MSWYQKLRALLQPRILRRNEDESDLEAELRFDLEEEARLRMDRGEPPESARASAQRDFGNLMLIKEVTRDIWGWTSLERIMQDVRFAWRMLVKSPAFTLVAIASLAIGIGANTAIFSLVDAILLRSLPVRDPQQLRLVLWTGKPRIPLANGSGYSTTLHGVQVHSSFSYPMYQLLRASVPQFSALIGFAQTQVTVTAPGASHYASVLFVTGDAFAGLGVTPLLGRMLSPEDDHPQAPPAAVLGYAYWESRFGRDPTVVGRTIVVDGHIVTVAGIAPQSFRGLEPGSRHDMFLPITHAGTFAPKWYALEKDENWWVQILGRLRPGVSDREARAALEVIMERAGAAYPEKPEHKRDPFHPVIETGAGGVPLMREQAVVPMFILSSVVGLVLLIACANIANLLLARATARRREIAIRLSIGAGRWRLIRQLLTESLLLAGLGAALGLIFATPLAKATLAMAKGNEPLILDTSLDARMLLFTAGVAILTAILFGLVPACRATRVDLTPALKAGSAGGSGATPQLRLSRWLVIGQVALSTLLLAGAALFVRTLANLSSLDPGFNARQLLIFSVDGSRSGYQADKLTALYERIRTRMAAIPGVLAVTLSSVPLIGDSMSNSGITIPGYTPKTGRLAETYEMVAGSRFLTTMGIPIVLGRDIEDRDTSNAPRIAVVNQTFAREYLGGRNPLGRIFYFGQPKNPRTLDAIEIVGVCGDAKYDNLKHEIPPTAYIPYLQNPDWVRQMTFEIRTALAPMTVAGVVRWAVAEIDPKVPVAAMRTQEEQIRQSLSMERLFATLVGSFGLVAALLAAIGIYGVMAYAVTRRTAEIGIRMALGAGRGDVQRMMLRESLLMVAIGMIAGIPAALAVTGFLREILYGIAPTDPVSFVAAGILMLTVAAVAAWLPARRAALVDPMRALRNE